MEKTTIKCKKCGIIKKVELDFHVDGVFSTYCEDCLYEIEMDMIADEIEMEAAAQGDDFYFFTEGDF